MGRHPDDRKYFVAATLVWAGFTAILICLMIFAGGTPRARLNILQAVSVVVFLGAWVRRRPPLQPAEESAQGGCPIQLTAGLALATVIYGSAFGSYFLADDFAHVYNARESFLAGLQHWFLEGQAHTFFRPVGFASLFLDYHLFHFRPAGYHAISLLLHLSSIVAVYCLCRQLALDQDTAATTSLFFAVLPIHAEPVAWIAARFDMLATSFTLWALVLYLRSRRNAGRSGYLGALALSALALLSKESAFALPLLLILIELLALPETKLHETARFVALSALVFVYRWFVVGGIGGYTAPSGTLAVGQVGFRSSYALLIRSPAQMLLGLNWLADGVGSAIVTGSALGALLLTVSLFSRPASNRKLRLLAIAWIIVGVLPAHFLASIGPGLTNSRILYLSSAGLAMFLALLCAGMPKSLARMAVIAGLATLFSLGLLHNLRAWRQASRDSMELITEVNQSAPLPLDIPLQLQFVELPDAISGVFFSNAGLPEAFKIAYGRDDVEATRCAEAAACPAGEGVGGRIIRFRWLGQQGKLVERSGD